MTHKIRQKWNVHSIPASLLLGLTLAGAGTAQAGYPEQVSALNPLGYWRLNETAQPAAADRANNIGSAGSAANGYYKTANVTHELGGALAGSTDKAVGLDGSSGQISVPWTDGVQNLKPPFTVEFWANADTAPYGAVPLSNTDRAAGRSGWLFYQAGERSGASTISGQGWNFWLGNTGGYTISLSGATAIQAGTWYHVAGVYDGTNAYLYVNGVQDATGTGDYAPNNAQPLTIGNRYDGTAYAFAGGIDEVAIYPTALTAAELRAHYQNGISVSPATTYNQLVLNSKPVAYYRLNEGAFTEPTTYPTAKNQGSVGAAADGAYHPGVATAKPSVAYTGFGANNYAAGFNGYQGYVDLGNPAELNFSGNITLLAWVKPNNTSSGGIQDLVIHGYGSSTEVGLRLNAGSYQAFSYDGSDHAASYTIPSQDVGNWVFLAGTYDGANWNLYRNGVLVATKADAVGAVAVDDVDWAIGAKGDGTERYFNGLIDEVAIYGKALDASQISELYGAAEVPPQVVAQPQAPVGALYAGNSATLSVTASGTSPLAYQWRKNGAALPDATASNLTWTALAVADSGAYDVVITNVYGAVTSLVATLSIQAATPPIIVTAPIAQTRYAGSQVVLSAAASGSTPFAYQWFFNGQEIAGANSDIYTIASAAVTDAGQYSVVITNAFGAVTSALVAVAIIAKPTTGYAQAVLADAPAHYWRLNDTNGAKALDSLGGKDGDYLNVGLAQAGYSATDADTGIRVGPAINSRVSVPGIDFSSGASFSLEAWVKVQPTQVGDVAIFAKGTGGGGEQLDLDIYSGHYRFFVRDASGATKTIDSTGNPDGTWQHLVAVLDASAAQLYLYLNGEQVGSTDAPSGALLSTTNAFSIGARQSGSASYDFNLDGYIDEVAVYQAALSPERVLAHYQARYGANAKPIIRAQPAATTNYVHGTAVFSVEADGPAPLSYQWKLNGTDLAEATGSTLVVSNLTTANAGNYTVAVANGNGSLTSSAAKLTVLPAPTSPVDLTAGQVLHLAFDGDYADSSTHGNDGTPKNSPTLVTGKVGAKALHYVTDTAASTYKYVTLGKPADLNFSSNINFSVAFWLRLPAGAQPGDLPIITSANNSTYNPGFIITTSYKKGGWAWGLNSSTAVFGPDDSINDGNWHHLAYVFDREGYAQTFLDGTLVSNRPISGRIGDLDTGNTVNIGQDPTGGYGEDGEGDLDDLGIWRRALTYAEVQALYTAGYQGVSFTASATAPSEIAIHYASGQATLTWTSGSLQQADAVTGAWTDVAATSPYTVDATASAKFYRLKN